MKNIVYLFLLYLCIACTQESQEGVISIDASKKSHKASIHMNGANMEDLNFQCYGGMYSQLLCGQDFEEHVDVDSLNLETEATDPGSREGNSRYTTFVMLDENGKPYITRGGRGANPVGNSVTEPYELSRKILARMAAFGMDRPGPRPSGAGPQGGPPPSAQGPRPSGTGPQGGLPPGGPRRRFGGPSFRPIDSLPADQQKILLERVKGDKQISRYWKEVNSGTAKGVFKLINKGQYKGRRD